MALQAHMTVEGTEQGKIEGECPMKGREGSIEVQQFDHEVYAARQQQRTADGECGSQAACDLQGVRQSVAEAHKALTRGERLKSVEIKWFRIARRQQEHYFTHKMEDAIIVSIKPYMKNRLDRDKEDFKHMEEVSFTYRKMTWNYEQGGNRRRSRLARTAGVVQIDKVGDKIAQLGI